MNQENKTNECIHQALNNNPQCRKGILNDRRIFEAIRKGKQELLVLVDSRFIDCVGHVAYLEGKWTSALIDITGYIVGNADGEVIQDFWENIEKRIGYDLPFVAEDAVDYMESHSFEEAVTNLIKMINIYRPAEWEPKSYAIYDLYGVEPMINGSNNTRR